MSTVESASCQGIILTMGRRFNIADPYLAMYRLGDHADRSEARRPKVGAESLSIYRLLTGPASTVSPLQLEHSRRSTSS